MTRKFLYLSMAMVMLAVPLWSCSGGSDGESEKGAIRQMTDQVADEMVDRMRSPIDKARSARDQGEDHLGDLEDAVADTEENE